MYEYVRVVWSINHWEWEQMNGLDSLVYICIWYLVVHRAVSPTLCDSYSHTVLSRLTINGVSAVGSSSGTPMHTRALAFKWCIAICDGGGGGVCIPLIWTWGGILWCRTPAIVPPYVGQWWAAVGWRGSVQVDTCAAYAFGTGLWN